MNLAHPFAVALSEVVVNGNDMNALSGERVKVSGKRRNEGFALSGTHLGYSALMKNYTADNLNGVVFNADNSA